MKKITKLLLIPALLGVTLASCNNNNSSSSSSSSFSSSTHSSSSVTSSSSSSSSTSSTPSIKVSITLTAEKTVIDTGSEDKVITVVAEVTTSGTDDKSLLWTTNSDLITVENGVVTYVGTTELVFDQFVSVTATSLADTNVFASITITLKAPTRQGQVGELTSQMIEEIGNSSITVNGELVDFYKDFTLDKTTNNTYYMVTKMEENAWAGEYWIRKNNKDGAHQVNTYKKGVVDGLTDEEGNTGHALDKIYINKDNVATRESDMNTFGSYNLWEQNHLWNHLGNLDINKFTYNSKTGAYDYYIDPTDMDNLYLPTYLSYSLTPLLSDTLLEISLYVEDGHVTRLTGSTEVLYYGSTDGTAETASAASWTTIDLTFADIGTTVVTDPTPYAATKYTEVLAKALEQMKGITNYTFDSVDTSTYSASSSENSYDQSRNSLKKKVLPTSSATGPAGLHGQVTEDAVLLRRSTYYSGGYFDNPYGLSYTGYKQNDDNTYDEFEYSASSKGLVGKKKYEGNISSKLPGFNFAPEVFGFPTVTENEFESTYTFTLRDSVINAAVAKEISSYSNASSASQDVETQLSITVDSEGNLLNTVYPYNISGNYIGYVKTTYSEIGTTKLDEDLFDNYSPRVLPETWDEVSGRYETAYGTGYTTGTVADALNYFYGADSSKFPTPSQFRSAFGDSMSVSRDLDYTKDGVGCFSFNITASEDLLNGVRRLTDDNFNYLMDKFAEASGYVKLTDSKHTQTSNSNNRNVTFMDKDSKIMIRFNNIGFKTIYVYCYLPGTWEIA